VIAAETAIVHAAPPAGTGLVLNIERALDLIRDSKDLRELRDLRDQAQLMEGLARARDASREAQNGAAEIKLRAERRMGEVLIEQQERGERQKRGDAGRAKANSPKTHAAPLADQPPAPKTLQQLGIGKDLARTVQAVAKVPAAKFDTFIRANKEHPSGEITTTGLLKVAKSKNPHAASHVNDGDPEKNVRFTHPELAEELHRRFRFTVDAFGHPQAPITKLIVASGGHFYTRAEDGFAQDYSDERFVFSNPEWDQLPEASYLAHQQAEAGCPGWLQVTPVTQFGRRYWLDFIEPYRPDRGGSGVRVEASSTASGGRWNYGKVWDPNCEDPENKGVGMPSCLVIWEGERRRAPDAPELVDCGCGHLHSEGFPCWCCSCKAGKDAAGELAATADRDASRAVTAAQAPPEAAVTYEWCQGSSNSPVHAFASAAPETFSRCGDVRRGAMFLCNIRGAPPSICPGCRFGVDADVAKGGAIDGLKARRRKSPPAAADPRATDSPLGSLQDPERFILEAGKLGEFSGHVGNSGGRQCVTVRCDAWPEKPKGWRCTKTFRFLLTQEGLARRAELEQLRSHAKEHQATKKRPAKRGRKGKR
jgi:hypothetical protein